MGLPLGRSVKECLSKSAYTYAARCAVISRWRPCTATPSALSQPATSQRCRRKRRVAKQEEPSHGAYPARNQYRWQSVAPVGADNESEWQDYLADDSDDQETVLAEREETAYRKSLLPSALSELTARERHIVVERHLKERPMTLEDLSRYYGISRERTRQIEVRAISKLRRSVLALASLPHHAAGSGHLGGPAKGSFCDRTVTLS